MKADEENIEMTRKPEERAERKKNMKADCHVHTEFSDDSVYPMEQVVQDAIEKGLDEICFTDHVDYGIKKDWEEGDIVWRYGVPLANVDYPQYLGKIRELQKKYEGRIGLKAGLEFGIQTHTIPKYEELFRKYPWDFILLSIHQVHDLEFWTGEFQNGKSQDAYNEEYYRELYDVISRFKDYSVLAHLDLIVRYDPEGAWPFEKAKPWIEKILKKVIEDGKGIELNTSSKRYGLSDLTPSRDILKLYHDLGGRIVTIGSDSHEPEHLGAYIDEAKEELKKLGFTEFCTFEKMEPVFHLL